MSSHATAPSARTPSIGGAAPPRTGWSLATGLGAVLSAFLASACCVGPLVFALLGLGGAGFLVKFEPYRPYFAVVKVDEKRAEVTYDPAKVRPEQMIAAIDESGYSASLPGKAGKKEG